MSPDPRSAAGQVDLADALAGEDDEITRLLDEYFEEPARSDHVRRAAIGRQVLERASVQDTVKEELLHRALHEAGRRDIADELDERARRRKQMLLRLDELSSGVTPRDVHLSEEGDDFDRAVAELRRLLADDLRYEREAAAGALRSEVGEARRSELAARAEETRRTAAVRPDPGGEVAHRRGGLHKRAQGVVSRLSARWDTPHDDPASKT